MIDHLSLISLTKAIIIFVVGFILAKVCGEIVKKVSIRYPRFQHLHFLQRLTFYGLLALFTISALQQLGFKLSVLIGAAGILTVAIGFASQTSAANFISGLFLIFDRSFALGDTITADGVTGKIVAIDALSIKLATTDNQYVRIPNDSLIKTNILNLTYYKTRRFDLAVGIEYSCNLEEVEQVMLATAAKNQYALSDPAPAVNFISFGDSAINLQLSVWTITDSLTSMKNSLPKEIKVAFEKNNINMPYPCMTIYQHETKQDKND